MEKNRMSKKFWTILGLLVVLTLTVAACSPAATPTEEEVVAPTEVMDEPTEAPPEPTEVMEEPTEEPEPTEEEMVEPELSLVIWADETRAPILQALAEDFQATYGVGLDVQQVTGINDQLPIAAPAGEGPDIFIGPHERLGGWVDSGLVTPVDLGAKEGEFLPVSLSAFTYDGDIYGLPYAFENMALMRNADLVPDAPATWDELLETGGDLMESGEITYALALENNGYKVYPILTNFGGYVFGRDENGNWNPDDLGIDSEGMIAAGDWMVENIEAGLISPNANDADTAETLFETGEVAYFLAGPWTLDRFRTAGVNYAISPFPDNGQPFGGIQGFMISNFSENKLLAQAFLTEFVATDEIMTELYLAGNRPSAYLPVLELTEDPDLAAFGEAGEVASLMPAIPEMGAVWGSWESAVQLVINGGDTPENAFNTAAQQIRDVLGGATAGMVNVPGSYQAAAGCEADWDPACEVTALTEGDDGMFTASHSLPAGDYEAKVALDGSWTVNYGIDGVPDGDNYTFSLSADGTVTFTYDPETNLLTIEVE
jgi:maltose/maltodextrin transport system substrate-binding protein/arabinogalactan oligomer/maltooligosaccharide transport system substrate-binding protein